MGAANLFRILTCMFEFLLAATPGLIVIAIFTIVVSVAFTISGLQALIIVLAFFRLIWAIESTRREG